MKRLLTLCLVIVGLINFVPVLGLLSVEKLESAYAVSIAGNDLAILMRHRALLFGILGGYVLFAAFRPAHRVAAMVMAGISMTGFAVLVLQTGGQNDAVTGVLWVDLVGLAVLLCAAVLQWRIRMGAS